MKATPLILILIILGLIAVYLAGKFNLFKRFLDLGKKVFLVLRKKIALKAAVFLLIWIIVHFVFIYYLVLPLLLLDLAIIIYFGKKLLVNKGILSHLAIPVGEKISKSKIKETLISIKEQVKTRLSLKKLSVLFQQYRKIIILVLCLFVVGLSISAISNKIADTKAKKEGCQPFTPLFLQKYKTASGVKPILGEQCTLSRNSYLIKLLYQNSTAAKKAKTGLVSSLEGERKELEGNTWITYQGSSSIFIVEEEKLGILVLLGETRELKVKALLEEVLQNEWSKESGNLTYDSKAIRQTDEKKEKEITTIPTKSESSEQKEILEEARRYVRMHGDVINFDLKITKKLADYALVQVVPEENIEGAAVILEKVDNRWVAQDMGTAFPEWEGRVPELFKWD